MKKPKREDIVTEIKCPACEGIGLAKVKQPVQPGRGDAQHIFRVSGRSRNEAYDRCIDSLTLCGILAGRIRPMVRPLRIWPLPCVCAWRYARLASAPLLREEHAAGRRRWRQL